MGAAAQKGGSSSRKQSVSSCPGECRQKCTGREVEDRSVLSKACKGKEICCVKQQEAKKMLTRLATKFSLALVFTLRKKEGDETATENNEEVLPKKKGKKKKKKKSQEQLKKAKEMKMEVAAAQVDVGVPSFSEFVTDNTEVVEEEAKRKRKGLEDGNSSRDKKHK